VFGAVLDRPALRPAAPASDALYAVNERGLDCAPIRGRLPIDAWVEPLLLDAAGRHIFPPLRDR
jgi:hypothetical protein